MYFWSCNWKSGMTLLLDRPWNSVFIHPVLWDCQSLWLNSQPLGGGRLVTKLCPTLVTPRTVACQILLSLGFPRQEYWSGLSLSSPGDLLDPEIEHTSPANGFLFTEPPGKPWSQLYLVLVLLNKFGIYLRLVPWHCSLPVQCHILGVWWRAWHRVNSQYTESIKCLYVIMF